MRAILFLLFIVVSPCAAFAQGTAVSSKCGSADVTGEGNSLTCGAGDANCSGANNSACTSAAKEAERNAASADWESACDDHCKTETADNGYKCVRENDGGTGSGSCDGNGTYKGSVSKKCKCKIQKKKKDETLENF